MWRNQASASNKCSYTDAWLGINDMAAEATGGGGTWVGRGGANQSYFNWAVGQPSTATGNAEDCVAVDVATGLWSDGSCREKKSFLCQRAKRKIDAFLAGAVDLEIETGSDDSAAGDTIVAAFYNSSGVWVGATTVTPISPRARFYGTAVVSGPPCSVRLTMSSSGGSEITKIRARFHNQTAALSLDTGFARPADQRSPATSGWSVVSSEGPWWLDNPCIGKGGAGSRAECHTWKSFDIELPGTPCTATTNDDDCVQLVNVARKGYESGYGLCESSSAKSGFPCGSAFVSTGEWIATPGRGVDEWIKVTLNAVYKVKAIVWQQRMGDGDGTDTFFTRVDAAFSSPSHAPVTRAMSLSGTSSPQSFSLAPVDTLSVRFTAKEVDERRCNAILTPF